MDKVELYRQVYFTFKELCADGKQPCSFRAYCKEYGVDQSRMQMLLKGEYIPVIERVGRARQKYPSISKYYVIDYIADDPKNPKKMADIQWRIAVQENVDKQSGIYFLRTAQQMKIVKY